MDKKIKQSLVDFMHQRHMPFEMRDIRFFPCEDDNTMECYADVTLDGRVHTFYYNGPIVGWEYLLFARNQK